MIYPVARPPEVKLETCKCNKCSNEWMDYPGHWSEFSIYWGGENIRAGCPKCGSLYWTVHPGANILLTK